MNKPNKEDITPSFHGYVDLIPDENLLKILNDRKDETVKILTNVPPEREEFSYEPDKWSLKKVVTHLISSECYFCGLVIRITKDSILSAPSYPFDKYDQDENAKKTLKEIIKDFQSVRQATIEFYENFDPELAVKVQTINGNKYTPVGVGFIIAGHEVNHLNVIREKYLVN